MDTTRIYIVEDEALIAMKISDRLTQLGYAVCGTAARGEQALEDIPRANPDIVLMDICLAGELTGIETAAKLRQLLDLPIVFLSAFSDAQLVEEAIGSGAFGYLVKPFDERELHATLQAALSKHRLERSLQEANANLDEAVRQRTSALMQSEAQLRDLFNGTSDLIHSVAPDGRFLFVNRAWRETLGYSADEVATLNIFDVIHAESHEHCRSFMQRILAGEQVGLVEILFRAKDGRAIVAEGHVSLRVEEGRPVGTRGIFRNITDRKLAEDQLRLTQFAVDHAVDAVLWADDTKRFVYANAAACRSLGYTREELLTLRIPDIAPQHDPEWFQQRLVSIKHSKSATYESIHRRKDGTEFPVEAAIAYLEHEGRGYTCGIVRDITERKRADQALRESEARFRTLFEQAAVGVAQIDTATGRFVRINQKYSEITGYSPTEMLALKFQQLTHPDDLQADLNNMARLTAGEIREFRMEKRYLRKDSSVVWVKLTVSPMWEPGAAPDYHIAVVQDITERKQTEAALQTFQDQIRQMQKMEAIGQLAGGVAHDFNNILTAILGNAEMAGMKLASDHPARPNLTRILEAGDRASRLVQQILTFTHQQELSRITLSLSQIVNEVLTLLRATLPAGIELTTTYDAATPPVLADATQVHQVLMNLCTNAWHALKEQPGSIAVDLAPVMLTHPLHSLHAILPPGRYARLSVRDTGCGMEPETVERIFDPFFTTKPVGQGTGLGLSVVHGIVRGHEGAIVVDSRPSRGTTVHLYFPAIEAPAQARESAGTTPAQRQGRNRHLLYLDDEEMLVELVRTKFEPLGYRVTGCTTPTEALDAVRADPSGFDVVVTDYNMPTMSGLEVASALARLRADLPVAVVSGYLSPAAQAAILAAGIKEIVYKPTLLQQLGDVIARLTNNQRRT